MVEIRRCLPEEVEELMQFLGDHWQVGHVLATSRALMDWQHRATDGRYNYVIAKKEGRMLGVLGYIPTSRFDTLLAAFDVVWLALWKVRADSGQSGLGLRLLRFLANQESHATIAVNGINLSHPPIYRALGYRVVELSQHFLVNPDARQTLISDTVPRRPVALPAGAGTTLTEVGPSDLDELHRGRLDEGVLPAKSPTYFRERFLYHPFYRYRVFHLQAPGCGTGLLALRVAEHEGRRVVRIVDFAGDPTLLGSCGIGLARVTRDIGAEYADLWAWGIDPQLLIASGFERLDPDGSTTVPNYFEPFLARNARILCAFRNTTDAHFRVFRADGDQDRPNHLEAQP